MHCVCFLAILGVVFAAPLNNQPSSIDEAIIQAMGGKEAAKKLAYTTQEDGTFLAELDMRLTPEQYSGMYMTGIRSKRKFERRARKWTNNLIPYVITSDFSTYDRQKIEQAMNHISEVTCLKFTPKTSSHYNYINYQNGNGCNSPLGMVGGRQNINLGPGCRFVGTVIHEIGHSLGLAHEHQLPDRDQYITIDLDKVDPQWRIWFKAFTSKEIDQTGVPYDYRSIMHYGIRAFSMNGGQTIHAKDKSKEYLIQDTWHKSTLAPSDIQVLNNIYCNGQGNVIPTCIDSNQYCPYWASVGECQKNPGYMLPNCKKSCNTC